MGKRKFRLKHVKNYEKKKYQNMQLKVSYPLHLVKPDPVSELMLCIPLNIYIKSLAPNASVLYSRVSTTKLVPKEWTTSILVSQSHSSLFSMK